MAKTSKAEPEENSNPSEAGEREAQRRMIDALMAEPPRDWPAIIVVGDDAVTAVYPMPPRDD